MGMLMRSYIVPADTGCPHTHAFARPLQVQSLCGLMSFAGAGSGIIKDVSFIHHGGLASLC